MPVLSARDQGEKLHLMPETWGWVPEFYIKTRRYQAHPGLLSTSKAEGYLQYYQKL